MKLSNLRKITLWLPVLLIFSVSQIAAQTGGDFTITQSVIAGGGGQNAAGGTFSLDGTIGQTIAESVPSSGGSFTLRSGFWNSSFTPTAAGVSLSGRVKVEGASGKGIRNAQLTLTNAATGEVFSTRSGSFGAYRFDDVPVGQTYVLTISARRFSFVENTRIIALFEELTDVDFVGAEQF